MDIRKLKEQLEAKEAALTAELETVMRELESVSRIAEMLDKYDIDAPEPAGGNPCEEVTTGAGHVVIVSRAWHKQLWDKLSSRYYRTAGELSLKIPGCSTDAVYKVLYRWTRDGVVESRVGKGQTHEYRKVAGK